MRSAFPPLLLLAAPFLTATSPAPCNAEWSQGLAACNAGRYAECEKQMRASLARQKNPPAGCVPHYYLGLAAYNQGKAPLAAACFDRAMQSGLGGPEAAKAATLRKVLADQKVVPDPNPPCGAGAAPARPPAAAPVAGASAPAPAAIPDWTLDYLRGRESCDRADWENCRKAMDGAIAGAPASQLGVVAGGAGFPYTPYYYRALAAFNLGDDAAAAGDLQKESGYSVIQKTSQSGAYRTLLRALVAAPQAPAAQQGAAEQAAGSDPAAGLPPEPVAADPEPAGPRDPAGAQADYVKGVQLMLGEKFPEAAAMFESALRRDPRPRQWTRAYGMWFEPYIPHYYLASCYFQMGRFDDARRHIRISQQNEMRGRLTDQSGRLLDMSQAIDKRQAQTDTVQLYNLGEGIMRMVNGDYDRAAIVFEFLTQASPRWAEAHLYLGICYFAQAKTLREKVTPEGAAKAGELEALARREFKAARKFDRKIQLSTLMLSPELVKFWNESVN